MPHGVSHFEIAADDPEQLVTFYTQLFDWKVEKFDMPGGMAYWSVSTVPTNDQGMPTQPGAINGGIFKKQAPDQKGVNYVTVESVDEYTNKAKSLGATVLMDKMPVPQMGWFTQVMDPQGNVFGIWQDDPNAA
jgi:predicted enzyme related to lactoylglutathione lyase